MNKAKIFLFVTLNMLVLIGCGGDYPAGPHTTTGSLEVNTITTGDTLDADGYMLSLDGEEGRLLEPDGSLMFEDIEEGEHELTVSGIQVNCELSGDTTRTVSVPATETISVNLNVVCQAAYFNRIVFYREESEGDFDLFVTDPGSSEITAIRNNNGADLFASLSPDGTQLAFQDQSEGDSEIAVMNIDGTGFTLLTENEFFDGSVPSWSPDGSRIVFSSYRDGDSEIYVMDVDGSNVEQLTDNEVFDAGPDWSSNGEQIVFTSGPSDNRHIYVMSADGSNIVQLTDDSAIERSAEWSPEGDRIAFERGFNIYIMNADGTEVQQLTTEGGEIPSWSPDGSRIVFESDRNGDKELYVLNADGTNLANLTNSPATEDGSPSWGPVRKDK